MTMPPPILVLVAFLMQHSICTAFAPPRASITSIGSANTNVNTNNPLTTANADATNNDADEIASASAPQRKTVTEISPLKASMLTKSWQSLLAEVDQKVGIVPELGSTSVGVQRFGPELERRTLCKRQFEFFSGELVWSGAGRQEREKQGGAAEGGAGAGGAGGGVQGVCLFDRSRYDESSGVRRRRWQQQR